METDLGETIKSQRRRLGWNQAELARRLGGVSQQTVSRWERGLSRPRRNMTARLAELFGIVADELLVTAGYTATADRPDQPTHPVRPRVTVLPVDELSPDRFEELVADVAGVLHRPASAARFGAPGHKQHGIDVIARDGRRTLATYQCKRRKQFGPQDVREAVTAVTIEASEHFLVLTRVASPECRLEMANHDGWTLWDVEDLSRVVRRDLPLEDAVRIVDTYFPGWREPLLGVDEPGPWLRAVDFFRPLGSTGIYTHKWQMVGRTEELEGILEFLEGSATPVGCVVGRGGIGKSRLLREVADRAEECGFRVRFLTVEADLKPQHFELLPADDRLLVILDDAHDRRDVAAVIRGVRDRNGEARVLLGLRPYGLDVLASDLRLLGLHPSELDSWMLDDLADGDADALARQALGPGWPESTVRRLGRLTADCPLVTVVGGVLIREGRLDPACLDHEDDIRTEILRAFRDVLVADPLSGDPELRRAVLDAVAVLQPFRSDDPAFQTALARLVDTPYDRAARHLEGLEDSGVLLRRGASLRVVPDLLGDVVLTEACFDHRSGSATGFIERVCEAADGQPLQHVFVNTTRVDWQVRHDRSPDASLASAIWDMVETEFKAAGVLGRRHLFQLLRKVAYFEPARTLELVRWAIDHPTEEVEPVGEFEEALLRAHPLTYDDVLRELPPLLRAVAYNFGHLSTALDVLWELAQKDGRSTNQHPEHPLRVLRDLAAFEVGKPFRYNEAVIDAAEGWLGSDAVASRHSPFEVLEPMLATEGVDHSTRGHAIFFTPYSLDPEALAPLRQRVIDLALREVRSGDVSRAARAIEAIEAAVRYPSGSYGREVSKAERDAWTPYFTTIIERLAESVASDPVDPVVVVAARRALSWHAGYSPTETRDVAQRARDSLPSSQTIDLALALAGGRDPFMEGEIKDYAQAEAERQARLQGLAGTLVAQFTDRQLADLIAERLDAQTAALGPSKGSPGQIVWEIVSARPSVGLEIVDRVGVDPASALRDVLSVAVSAVAEHLAEQAMPAVASILTSDDVQVRRQTAHAFGWGRGARTDLLVGEFELLQKLARDTDPYVRTSIVRAAQRLAPHDPGRALSLISEVPFADSTAVAEEVFQAFGPHGDLEWNHLPTDEADRMLAELEACPSIEDYSLTAFLSRLSKEDPAGVVRLLRSRVERWEHAGEGGEYRALPFHWDHPLQAREHAELPAFLREIQDWIADAPYSWKRHHGGGELFAAVARTFDETVLQVLEQGAGSGDQNQVGAVAAILRHAPRSLVFENVDFVRRILAEAVKLNEESVQRVGAALSAAVVSGVRSGTPGQPFQEDLDQRNRAREIADKLPQGSIEERFYRSLQESAEHSIKWNADQDERLKDHRDW